MTASITSGARGPLGRPADRSEVRLPAGRQPAEANDLAIVRRVGRYAGLRAGVLCWSYPIPSNLGTARTAGPGGAGLGRRGRSVGRGARELAARRAAGHGPRGVWRASLSPWPKNSRRSRYQRFVPSSTALGIAGVMPAYNSVSMFAGGTGCLALARARPDSMQKYTISARPG